VKETLLEAGTTANASAETNILKRLLVHVAGMNLGLLLRSIYGIGTPRGLQGLSDALAFLFALIALAAISENSQASKSGITADHLVAPKCHSLLGAHFRLTEIQNPTSTRTARVPQ
jgi:hypothetical protein